MALPASRSQPGFAVARVIAVLAAWLCLALPASAQNLPPLTGRVVDQADLLPPDREAALTSRLEALERASSRQLVVVTVPDLQGLPIEDFGFRLGEAWKIGDEQADNGAILLIAVAERKMRIEVGDGLEPILTDAMSGLIIRDTIRPRFQEGDHAGGIEAGVERIIEQLQAPPEVAEQRALEAARAGARDQSGESGSIFPLVFWIVVLFFILMPMLRSGFGGRKYRGRRRGRGGPVILWGPGLGSGWGGSSSGGWGGGGGFGGGFSGGGGSFGGGGASGGW